jgi:hypothetical protein
MDQEFERITTEKYKITPDGKILYSKDVKLNQLRGDDLLISDKILNEAIEEIEYEKSIDTDMYPLKSIRKAAISY